MKLSILFALIASVALAQPRYDLVLKGGHVIDPKNQIDAIRDVAISNGKIALVAASIDGSTASKVIDASGLYVTPGIVDMHVHVFHTTNIPAAWAGDYSVDPDSFSFRSGVTTMVDAGSAGYRNFDQFRATVINRSKTRIFAMINIAGYGMMTNVMEQDVTDMLPERVAEVARRNKDVVVGVKSAHFEKPNWTSVDRAVEAGKLANVPVMVDFGFFLPERPYWQLVTEHLRPGDISTHVFRAAVPWIDENGKVYDYLKQARARGVKFDVGHGSGSLAMRNAVPAIAQGFYPDSISTDLHVPSMNKGLMDFPTTASKFLAMGMPLTEVVLRSTWNPARMIHHPEVGHLTVGAVADVTVWSIEKGVFGFRDSSDAMIKGVERLRCEMTLKDGVVEWDWNSRSAVDYRKLGPAYGLRPGADVIVLPPKPSAAPN